MESSARLESGRHRVWRWLDNRLGIQGLRYSVPAHANSLAYTLGGITLASFTMLVITGIYLAQFYDPTPAGAHASISYITDTAFAGAVIRSLHYWLATAFTITLVLHMVRTFATGSFKAPREFIWITGVVLFLPCDVVQHTLLLGNAHAERRIAELPRERPLLREVLMDPF